MNFKMLIQYDGSRYEGWQRQQRTGNTIQGKIEEVLSKMEGSPVEIHGAGRTDAGVHAEGQTANVRLSGRHQPEEIQAYLNQYLPEDIGILEVKQVSDRFHSRLNAREKIYRYRIATKAPVDVFQRKYVYGLKEGLDVKRMQEAAAYLTGKHDFQGFCARKMKKSSVRRVDEILLEEKAGELWITYRGNGFLYQMVRIMTGTLIEVGLGRRTPQSVKEALEKRERALAGAAAPAKGLTLVEVRYQ